MFASFTVSDSVQGGHEVVVADDGQPHEHVDGDDDVDDDPAVLPTLLSDHGGRELLDGRRHTPPRDGVPLRVVDGLLGTGVLRDRLARVEKDPT